MRTLRRTPGLANAEISRRTQLAPQTVSLIINDLSQQGFIEETEPLRGMRGQPARPRVLKSGGAFSFGCAIAWKYVDVVLTDLTGKVLNSYHRAYDYPDADILLNEIVEVIASMRGDIPVESLDRIEGLGVAMPTNIWLNIGRLNPPEHVTKTWRTFDVAKEFKALTGLDTKIINDGSAASHAEQALGVGNDYPDFVYFFISQFVCGGLVIENKIFNGPSGNSGNLGGILVLNRSGKPEFVHLIASLFALKKEYLGAGEPVPEPDDFAGWRGQKIDLWIEAAGHAIALAIANCGAVVESPVAIIDGRFPSAIRDRLTKATSEYLQTLPDTTFETPIVVAGKIGHMAEAIGAADIPIHERHFSFD